MVLFCQAPFQSLIYLVEKNLALALKIKTKDMDLIIAGQDSLMGKELLEILVSPIWSNVKKESPTTKNSSLFGIST